MSCVGDRGTTRHLSTPMRQLSAQVGNFIFIAQSDDERCAQRAIQAIRSRFNRLGAFMHDVVLSSTRGIMGRFVARATLSSVLASLSKYFNDLKSVSATTSDSHVNICFEVERGAITMSISRDSVNMEIRSGNCVVSVVGTTRR